MEESIKGLFAPMHKLTHLSLQYILPEHEGGEMVRFQFVGRRMYLDTAVIL